MKLYTYGNRRNPAILMIHGMGCSSEKSFSDFVQSCRSFYYIITVDLDGHDGEETVFTTIYDQAEQIREALAAQGILMLHGMVGMSLGGFVAMDLVFRCGMKTKYFIFDSGFVPPLPFKKPFSALMAYGFDHVIQEKEGIVERVGMALLMGYRFRRNELCTTVRKESIYRVEYGCMNYRIPENLKVLNSENTFFLYGRKEKFIMIGMGMIKKRLKRMKLYCVGDYGHGEFMYTRPESYTYLLNYIFEKGMCPE